MLKKINIKEFHHKFSFISFLLLFPGFFIYHYLVARSYLEPYLGGYFSIMAIILFPLLLILNLKNRRKLDGWSNILFFLINALIILVSGVNYLYDPLFGWADEMFIWSLSGVLYNLVCYFIGSRLVLNAKRIKLMLIAFLFMALLVFLNVGDMGIFYVKQEAQANFEKVATYQGFGRSLVISILVIFAYFWRSSVHYYWVFAIAALALFFNGSRTEFSIYIITTLFVSFLYILQSYKALVGIVVFAIIAFGSYVFLVDFLPESRMFQLIDIASSSSGEARMELFLFGLDLINKNPIFGAYGQYVQLGGIGFYPHNIFSAWVNLGFLGFVLYLAVFIIMWRDALAKHIVHKNMLEFKLFLFFLFFVSISLLVSKDYSYMLFGFVVGLYANYKNQIRETNS